jgi:ribosome biogenesis GTPase / thiamine phosphate phosphatase
MTQESQHLSLRAIGWSDADAAVLTPAPCSEARLVRVVAQHRTGYEVHDGDAVIEAGIQSSLRKPNVAPELRPAVGDWVWIAPADDGGMMIRTILPRRSLLQRAAAGEKHRAQIIATNIDWVFIVCGLDGDFNPRRIERYLTIVRDSGARALILLTKSDQCETADEMRAEVIGVAGDSVPVLAINAKSAQTIDLLEPYLGPGNTFVLVGSSGAGKSTLTNTLLGTEKMRTNSVRENDSRGRHTTTHRALIPLLSGACLIDTPGMREIKLLGEETLDIGSFADIENLGAACRFSNCGHGSEPGCAINAALADGTLDAERYQSYLKLQGEQAAAQQRAAAGEKRLAERAAHKTFNKRLVEKYGKR